MKTFKSFLELLKKSHDLWVRVGTCLRSELKDGQPSFYVGTHDPIAKPWIEAAWKHGNITAIQEFFLNGRICTEGPKIFRPTYEQCLALEQVEPRVSAGEYRQPYPTMIVDLPQRYQEKLRTTIKNDLTNEMVSSVPVAVCIHHDAVTPCLVCATYWDTGSAVVRTIHHCNNNLPTIADVFNNAGGLPPGSYDLGEIEEDNSISCLRMAVNSLLLLVHYGHRVAPENPSLHTRLLRYAANAKKRGHDTQAKVDLQLEPHLVDFEQNITLYETRPAHGERGEPTGRTVGFYHVRGHIRMQAYGPGSTLRKQIFVKPYMVHPELARGPVTVNYTIKGAL